MGCASLGCHAPSSATWSGWSRTISPCACWQAGAAWFYQALEPLAPARLWQYHSGDLLNRAISDVGVLENLYVRAVAPPLTALLVAIAGTAFLSAFVPPLGLVLLGFLLLGGVILPLGLHLSARRPGEAFISARAQLSALLVDGIQGLARPAGLRAERSLSSSALPRLGRHFTTRKPG